MGSSEPGNVQNLPAPEHHELLEGPTREQLIRRRAYDLYRRNGCVDGHALEDWLTAEAELGLSMAGAMAQASPTPAAA